MEAEKVDSEGRAPLFKVGEWVYTYLGRVQWPFKCKVVRVIKEEYGVFNKKFKFVYGVQIPEQEWAVQRNYYEIARTQSELNSW